MKQLKKNVHYITLAWLLIIFSSTINYAAYIDTSKGDYNVSVFAKQEQGIISPLLMGFNIVYAYEKDAPWKEHVPELLKKLNVKPLRWPGGTVSTFYHWNNLTGQGWADSWSPSFDASKNAPPLMYMDLDEYLTLTKRIKSEPLVGINMGSGQKYNRVKDGIEDAKKLMKYCLSKGVKVKYYYLDNEPYQPDANYTFTAEEYADNVNNYATEMKKIDPDIKIIVNTHPNNDVYTKTLISKAGKNIDYVDVHFYWRFRNATFNNWKAEPKMTHRRERPYSEQRAIFRKIFAEAGFPDIEMMVLEWNIGPNGTGNLPPTEAEAALMVAEEFTQFIQSGLFMSCFWPISTPTKVDWANRALMNSQNNHDPNKVYDMFTLYTDVLGQQQVKTSVSADRLITIAVKSKPGNEMWVYMINKNLEKPAVDVNVALSDFKASGFSAVGFESADSTEGPLKIKKVDVVKKDASHFTLSVPQFSFVKVMLKK